MMNQRLVLCKRCEHNIDMHRFSKRNTEEYKKHRKKYMKQYYQKNKEVKRI